MLPIEPVPLSPDLEWLLQSDQSAPEALAYLLVRDYFARLQRAAWGWLTEGEAADAAALSALVEAAAHPERYRAELGAEAWLFGLLIEECRRQERLLAWEKLLPWMGQRSRRRRLCGALDRRLGGGGEETHPLSASGGGAEALRRLPAETRQAYALVRLGGLPCEQAAAWLGRPADALARSLALAQDSVAVIAPAVELDEEGHARLAQEVAAQAGIGARRDRRLAGVRELALVGLIGLGLMLFLWLSPVLAPDDPIPTPTPRPAIIHMERELVYVTPTPRIISGTSGEDIPFLLYHPKTDETLDSIAPALGVTIEDLREWNPGLGDLRQSLAGAALRFDYDGGHLPEDTVLPPNRTVPHRPPLNAASTAEEIRARLVESADLWSTLWVDFLTTFHGSEEYLGPGSVLHQQVWISRMGQRSLVLEGPPGATARSVNLTLREEMYIFYPERGRVAQTNAGSLLSGFAIGGLVFPDRTIWTSDGETLINRGVESLAGREALRVDWTPSGDGIPTQLWIDTLTGIVLRERYVSDTDPELVTREITAQAVEIDPLLPLSAFWLRSNDPAFFYEDAEHTFPTVLSSVYHPIEIPVRPSLRPVAAPPGFDPSTATLAFDFNRYASLDELTAAAPLITAGVWARLPDEEGGVFLFDMDMGSPFLVRCARSPDGARFAWIDSMDAMNASGAPLRWADLRAGETHTGPPSVFPGEFAFSPDGSKLAMVYQSSGIDTLAVLDLDANEMLDSNVVDGARSLVWSSDGQYLLYLAGELNGLGGLLVVRDLDDNTLNKVVDTPSLDDLAWAAAYLGNGVTFPAETFPVQMGGLEVCAAVPSPVP